MAEELYKLEIITPEKVFYEENISMIVFKTTEGDIGVLKNHMPLTTLLSSGLAKIKVDDKEKEVILHEGFVEIKPEKVTILTDAAEWPDEIDLNRAKAAKQRAESLLKKKNDQVDIARAEAALMRAVARIENVEQ